MTSTGFAWADFYLVCFAVGFCFSFISFVFGSPRMGHLHLPHFHGHDVPHMHVGGGHVGHAPVGDASAGSAPHGAQHGPQQGSVSPFNPPTIAAFLAWFGGTGYLLSRFSALRFGVELTLSILVGMVGGAIVFVFLTKFLLSGSGTLDPADYYMVGVLGRLSVSIREGGTGELIYSQAGTRRVCGARTEDGRSITKGAEVVVTRYEKGIAYVRLFSEMSGEEDEPATEKSANTDIK